jgi:Ca2+-binding EF-hand superfamily protein
MTRQLLCLALLLSALAVPALAQGEHLLAALDKNGDGAITREDAVMGRQDIFARIDQDGSGTLTKVEIDTIRAELPDDTRMPAPGKAMSLDADADGQLTRAEFTSQTPGFDRADRDGDGVLSGAEIDRMQRFLGLVLANRN